MPPAYETLVDEALPPQYEAAHAIAERMLHCASAGDWAGVARLRQQLPALASSLQAAWDRRPAVTVEQEARREALRVQAIARVLAIDARIRELAQPWRLGLDQMMAGPRQSQ
ncbi:MAG: flagellar protein FliT [Lautropia sp.]